MFCNTMSMSILDLQFFFPFCVFYSSSYSFSIKLRSCFLVFRCQKNNLFYFLYLYVIVAQKGQQVDLRHEIICYMSLYLSLN
jgi:hypothetical protein